MGAIRKTAIAALLGVAAAVQISTASASVVMPNTRVIYNGGAQEQSIQFTNEDESPSVMQVWSDSGDEQSTPKTADSPFIVTPPVFRIEPKAGQTVRIVFTGKQLPQDRESVFYLNTLQIPSISNAYADQNQMLVVLRNRVKIFYRPAGIEGSPQKAVEKLAFHVESKGGALQLAANNDSNYYISIVNGELICGSHTAKFTPGMIAPRADARWAVVGACPAGSTPAEVKFNYVDDYGALRSATSPVAAQAGK
jgi:fimbrial chaperone protein